MPGAPRSEIEREPAPGVGAGGTRTSTRHYSVAAARERTMNFGWESCVSRTPRASPRVRLGGTCIAPLPGVRIFSALVIALLLSLATTSRAEDVADQDLAHQQDRVEKHLLRVQQERFEARARGEDVKSLRRLDREFKRTYGRRNEIIDERKQLESQ